MSGSFLRAAVALAAALALAGTGVRAQTVEELVSRHLQAKGGVEKLKSVNSVKITGVMTAQGMELPMTTWAKRPNMMRRELQLKDQKMVSAFDGSTVWMINPMMGSTEPQEVTGPPADMTRQDAEFDPLLLDYAAKGHAVELVGTETVAGQSTHHLKVTRKAGDVQHVYLDAETGLERRMSMTIEQGGMTAEVSTEFSDYREVDGLTVPFKMRQSMNGTPVAELSIETIEFNIPIDDAMFQMPRQKNGSGW